MKRYPAFDPPEYADWRPDPELTEDYAARIETDPGRAQIVATLSNADLLGLYRDLLRTRLHDIGLARWVRTGVISKAWLGTGEEAATVGAVAALDPERDLVCPMIRNAGALHMMGMSLPDMFRGYLATQDSPTGGRDLHIGDLPGGIVQPISHMGTSVPIMAGIALSFRLRGEPRVALTWVGDGAVRTAAFHEGINFAATQNLPLVVVLQNNQVALGTTREQHSPGELHRVPEAYGVPSWSCDGNHVLDVYASARQAVARCRDGQGPALIVASTFRMGGHATHDEREARETFAPSLFEWWGKRDPIGSYEEYLKARGLSEALLEQVEAGVLSEMEIAAEEAVASRHLLPPGEAALYSGFSEGSTLISLEKRPL